MRGQRNTFSAGFEKGLRPSGVSLRNSALLVDCRGGRISEKSIEGYSPDLNNIQSDMFTFTSTLSSSWPFPQIFLTDVGLFIGAKEGLYWISNPNSNPITLYSFSTGAVVWPWTVAPIPGYPAFASGSVFVYYDGNAAAYKVVT